MHVIIYRRRIVFDIQKEKVYIINAQYFRLPNKYVSCSFKSQAIWKRLNLRVNTKIDINRPQRSPRQPSQSLLQTNEDTKWRS